MRNHNKLRKLAPYGAAAAVAAAALGVALMNGGGSPAETAGSAASQSASPIPEISPTVAPTRETLPTTAPTPEALPTPTEITVPLPAGQAAVGNLCKIFTQEKVTEFFSITPGSKGADGSMMPGEFAECTYDVGDTSLIASVNCSRGGDAVLDYVREGKVLTSFEDEAYIAVEPDSSGVPQGYLAAAVMGFDGENELCTASITSGAAWGEQAAIDALSFLTNTAAQAYGIKARN